jgi:hypothetical protein
MPFVAFHELCPDVAHRETRTITMHPGARLGVPAGEYHFIEMFCDEPRCDCRRVFFSVFSSTQKRVEAIIAWGWEDRAFYMQWLGINDPRLGMEMQGPVLNLGSPQSENAEALLELTRNVLLVDPLYVERIKRHYALFRSKIDDRVNKANNARRRGRAKRKRR